VAGSIEPPESDESNSLALRLPTAARGAVCRSAGVSSLGTVGRSPVPFALAFASASLLRRSWNMSGLKLPECSRGQLRYVGLEKGQFLLLHDLRLARYAGVDIQTTWSRVPESSRSPPRTSSSGNRLRRVSDPTLSPSPKGIILQSKLQLFRLPEVSLSSTQS
jgi:hypothetical protein